LGDGPAFIIAAMSFLAVLLALLVEQAKPLAPGNAVHALLRTWAKWASRNLDAGRQHHGWVTWVVAAVLPAVLAFAVHLLVWRVHPVLAFVWNVAVLYVALGFRQFSHHFTEIRDALDLGDETRARQLLADWQQVDASELPRSEIVRHVIEHSVLAAHRHVFGVLSWYSVLAAFGLGPTGAVLYRMSEFAHRYWSHKSRVPGEGVSPALLQAARSAWGVIDYVPARMTAVAFAVVGSFEDAIDSWRHYAQGLARPGQVSADERNRGVVLAATAGAVNVRLGGSALRAAASENNGGEMGEAGATLATPGREPELAHLRSIVGLVWRSVVLWMVLLALLTLARLLG
jgi:adenosylcobinamide-phosphate synthase